MHSTSACRGGHPTAPQAYHRWGGSILKGFFLLKCGPETQLLPSYYPVIPSSCFHSQTQLSKIRKENNNPCMIS